MPRADRSNSLTPSARSTAATCCEMPDWVAFSRSAARVNEPSSQTAMTARTCRRAISTMTQPIMKTDGQIQNILFWQQRAQGYDSIFSRNKNSADAGRTHGNGKFRHRRIGLAATRQLGATEEVSHRAGARAHEEARPRRHAVHVRRERALSHRDTHAGLEPAQAGPSLCAAVRRRRAGVVRAGRPRLPDRTPLTVDPERERPLLLRLDQRRRGARLAAAGEEVHRRD